MTEKIETLQEILLSIPSYELDASMKPLIKQWSNPPKPIEILEVLDKCIFSALASGFIIQTLQIFYNQSCKDNNITHKELEPLAVWRENY